MHRVPVSAFAHGDASLSPDATILEAARLLEANAGGPVLIERGGQPLGILSEDDIVAKVLARGQDPRRVAVRDIMEAVRLSRDGAALLVEDDGAASNPLHDFVPMNRLNADMEAPLGRQLNQIGTCEECETDQEFLFDYEGLILCEDCLEFHTSDGLVDVA